MHRSRLPSHVLQNGRNLKRLRENFRVARETHWVLMPPAPRGTSQCTTFEHTLSRSRGTASNVLLRRPSTECTDPELHSPRRPSPSQFFGSVDSGCSSASITPRITATTSVVSSGGCCAPIVTDAEPGTSPPSCLMRLASDWA